MRAILINFSKRARFREYKKEFMPFITWALPYMNTALPLINGFSTANADPPLYVYLNE